MAEKDAAEPQSKEEQIGFHKGSLSTLAKERQELARILQIVEQLMQNERRIYAFIRADLFVNIITLIGVLWSLRCIIHIVVNNIQWVIVKNAAIDKHIAVKMHCAKEIWNRRGNSYRIAYFHIGMVNMREIDGGKCVKRRPSYH